MVIIETAVLVMDIISSQLGLGVHPNQDTKRSKCVLYVSRNVKKPVGMFP